MIERIVIVGAGRTSDSLVERLQLVAPVTVLDTSPDALEQMTVRRPGPEREEAVEVGNGQTRRVVRVRHPVQKKLADGTSRVVLEDLRGKIQESVGLVAATGSDRMNLEVCRIASALEFKPVIAIAIDTAAVPRYREIGIRSIPRATLLADVVERAIHYDGIAVASNLGLGKGDIIEVRVGPSSPAVGTPLAKMDPEGWRIAAIYRHEELVIPTGATTIEPDDRVLLVGDPDILPFVAENFRIGLPNFPLRHGPHIVVYLPHGRDRGIEGEAEVLALKTRAAGLVRVYPGAEKAHTLIPDDNDQTPTPGHKPKFFEDAPLEGSTIAEHVHCILSHRPGLVVARAEKRSLWQRLAGTGGRYGELCNPHNVPVLFPRGAPHYERIVFVLAAGMAELRAADAAIDLARMLKLPILVARVELPRYLGSPDPLVDEVGEGVERRARLYGLSYTASRLEGNPIAQVLKVATRTDLLVAARHHTVRDSFTSPDVALRLAQSAPSSTLVVTV